MFTFHEFSTAPLSVHVIYAVGISAHARSEPFLGHEDNVVIDACGESKCFLALTRFYSNVHAHSLIKARTLSICFLYFPWRIVSQKSTFKGKSLMF